MALSRPERRWSGRAARSEAELTGTFTAANVVGPAGQGIAAGEFAELVKALRSGLAYANLHDFVGDAPQYDDVTIVALRWLGTQGA